MRSLETLKGTTRPRQSSQWKEKGSNSRRSAPKTWKGEILNFFENAAHVRGGGRRAADWGATEEINRPSSGSASKLTRPADSYGSGGGSSEKA